jgi:hypothetical protein
MDYQDVYYVDERNAARPVAVIDHRTGTRVPSSSIVGTRVPAAMPPALAPAAYPQGGYYPQPNLPINPAGTGWGGYPLYPPYVTTVPTASAAPSNLASIIGGFGDLGGLASIAAQVFAALLPLPASPTPLDNLDTDPATNAQNNSSNLIRYQSALAQFARRDQQILTIGSVLKELFKRPGMTVMG